MADALKQEGMAVQEDFGTIESFEKTSTGVRMTFSKDGDRETAEAALVVVAVGWAVDTEALNLAPRALTLRIAAF